MKYDQLPVYRQKKRILKELKKNQVVIVESPTGSGKTTQIPIILHEAGYSKHGMIGVTQPRRIATLSVSEFISKQLKCQVGEKVGYKMRFEDRTSPSTVVKIMTDGILLQELKTDPGLLKYSVIMVDEAHERSLNIDFILGLLKQLIIDRPELKIIISSATINSSIFSTYFNNCPIVKIDTPIYPIDIRYQPVESSNRRGEDKVNDEVASIVVNYIQNLEKETVQGDILVFLQGERNIKECAKLLMNSAVKDSLFLLTLYGRLGKEEQERVFIPTPEGKTKVVISTNIAETSVTIDKISVVIDCGLAKINFYNPATFASSLIEKNISRASADQRKGRSGRTGPGICYRLYSEYDFDHREEYTLEEIYRTDLSEVVLRMSDLSITDFEEFDYISPPLKEGIISAIQTLRLLKAIDKDRNLTEIGKKMVYFPLSPRHARIIVEAIFYRPSVMDEVLIAASFLSANSPFLLPQGEEMEARIAHHAFQDKFGDFVSYLKMYKRYHQAKSKEEFCSSYYLDNKTMTEITNIKIQLEEMVSEMGIPVLSGGGLKDYLLAVSTGLIQFVCVNYRNNSYRSLTAEKIAIHPGSVMFRERPDYLVAGEIVKTSKMFARSVSPLKKEWIDQLQHGLLKELREILKDDNQGDRYNRDQPQRKKVSRNASFPELQSSPKRQTKGMFCISGHEIELKPYKGKQKLAVIHWHLAKQIAKDTPFNEFLKYSKMRGTIRYQGKDLFANHKIPNLFLAAKHIDPDKDIITDKLTGSWYAAEHPMEIINRLDLVLKLTPNRKKGLAAVALNTDGSGTFWFSPNPSFLQALDNSINSLDFLSEAVYSLIGEKEREKINKIYRKLSNIAEMRFKV